MTNTPWGERHAYVLPGGGARPTSTRRCTSRRSWEWSSATTRAPARPASAWSSTSRAAGTAWARVRRDAGTPPPRADAALGGPPDCSLSARERTRARADLRPRAAAETRRRARVPPPDGSLRRDRPDLPVAALAACCAGSGGRLTVIEDGEPRVYGSGPPAATIDRARVPRRGGWRSRGSRGLADAYAAGHLGLTGPRRARPPGSPQRARARSAPGATGARTDSRCNASARTYGEAPADGAGATSPPTTTWATSCSPGCSTRR